MAFAIDTRRCVAAFAAVACTAALVWFGNGLDPWWPLMWFAPLPVLWVASRSSWWTTALTAFAAMLLGSLSMWHYFELLSASPTVWLIVYSMAALTFAVAVLLFRALLRRGAVWSALVAFPAMWVVCEYARNLLTPHGTAGSLAYTQLQFLPFLQLASITGPWGMSFLLLLFPAALAIGIHLRQRAPKQAIQVASASLGVIAVALVFGVVRLAQPAPQSQVKVGLIASDKPGNVHTADDGEPTARLFRNYADAASKLAAQGARVIVIPEKTGTVTDPNTEDADAIFQSVADTTGATVVAGVVHKAAAPLEYNQARVYAPKMAVVSYDKHHMLPPFESMFTPGTSLTLLKRTPAIWGVAICKDMDFTPLARDYGRARVGLMLDPAWDFNIDRGWHGHIAMMRGVESGFSIAHTAKNGYLTVSDDRGRILAQTRSDAAPFATLLAEVPVTHDVTLYLLAGDWFAWVAIAMLAFAIIQLRRPTIE